MLIEIALEFDDPNVFETILHLVKVSKLGKTPVDIKMNINQHLKFKNLKSKFVDKFEA